MMKAFFYILTLLYSTSIWAESVDTIPANNKAIEYTGRIDFSNEKSPTFSYSGVSIRACFTGTSIAAILSDDTGNNYYNVILDGQLVDTFRISTTKKTYYLAENLDNTVHEIELFKRTELTFGKTTFYGFVVDKGASLTTIVNKRDKLIEFIGNSITCGYGNEGVNGGVFGPTTENHYQTFAAITSRNFNARHMAVCRSGIGIYRNYNGPITGNEDCMTNLYTRTFLYDENPKYKFAEQPDLVCIDLGTNDFSTTGGDSARFVNNYLRLIDTIQTKYTNPEIICLLGPMISGSTLSKVRNYLHVIVDSASRKEKGNVHFFEMSAQSGDLGIGIDSHPTVAQHKKNAQELSEFIKSLKGWKIKPYIVQSTTVNAKHITVEYNTQLQDKTNKFVGFEILGNNQKININKVYIDTTNHKIIHIITNDNLFVGEKLSLSYASGSFETTDLIVVESFKNLTITNKLTETSITNISTNKIGKTITITFNKELGKKSSIEGLSITSSKGAIAIDSFYIANTQLTLYLKDKIIINDSVFLQYTGKNIYGKDELALLPITKLVVKNNSKYTALVEYKQNMFMIYPNPSTNAAFNYKTNNTLQSSNNWIEVYNNQGIQLLKQKITQSEGQIELKRNIPKGVYIVKFISPKSTISQSIIIE